MGSNYDYHSIIKEFQGKFNCLGENTEGVRKLIETKEITKTIP